MPSWTWLGALAGLSEGAANVQRTMTDQSKLEYEMTKDRGTWEHAGRPSFFDALFGYNPPGTMTLGGNRYRFQPYKPLTAEDVKGLGLVTAPHTEPAKTFQAPWPQGMPASSEELIQQMQRPPGPWRLPDETARTVPFDVPERHIPGGEAIDAFVGMTMSPADRLRLAIALMQERGKYGRMGTFGDIPDIPPYDPMPTYGGAAGGGAAGAGPAYAARPAPEAPQGEALGPTYPREGPQRELAAGTPGTRPRPPGATRDFPGIAKGITPEFVRQVDAAIDVEAPQYRLRPELVKTLLRFESQYDPKARSPAGAVGLMQLMQTTGDGLGVLDRTEWRQNLSGGIRYLAQLVQKYKGDERLALAEYNAGPVAMAKAGGNQVPNIKETQDLVANVLAYAPPGQQTATDLRPPTVGTAAPGARVAQAQPGQPPPGAETPRVPSGTALLDRLPPPARTEYEGNTRAIREYAWRADAYVRRGRAMNIGRAGAGNADLQQAGWYRQEITRLQNRNADILKEARADEIKERDRLAAPGQAADVKIATQEAEVPEPRRRLTALMFEEGDIPSPVFSALTDRADQAKVFQREAAIEREAKLKEQGGRYVGNALDQIMLDEGTPAGKMREDQWTRALQRGPQMELKEKADEQEQTARLKANAPLGREGLRDYVTLNQGQELHPKEWQRPSEARESGYIYAEKSARDTLRNARSAQNQIESIDTLLHGGIDYDGRITGEPGKFFPGIHAGLRQARSYFQRAGVSFDVLKAQIEGQSLGFYVEIYNRLKAGLLASIGRNLGEDRGHFSDRDAIRADKLTPTIGVHSNGILTMPEKLSQINMTELYGIVNDRIGGAFNYTLGSNLPWRRELMTRKAEAIPQRQQWLKDQQAAAAAGRPPNPNDINLPRPARPTPAPRAAPAPTPAPAPRAAPPTQGATPAPPQGATATPSPTPAAPTPAAPAPTQEAPAPQLDAATKQRIWTAAWRNVMQQLFPRRGIDTLSPAEREQVRQGTETEAYRLWQEEQARGRR